MGFFKKLFKKKPGGTFFGNLLRKTASSATGGILGQGLNKIPLGTQMGTTPSPAPVTTAAKTAAKSFGLPNITIGNPTTPTPDDGKILGMEKNIFYIFLAAIGGLLMYFKK